MTNNNVSKRVACIVLSSLPSNSVVIGFAWNFHNLFILWISKIKMMQKSTGKCHKHNTFMIMLTDGTAIAFSVLIYFVILLTSKTCEVTLPRKEILCYSKMHVKWFKVQNFCTITEFKCRKNFNMPTLKSGEKRVTKVFCNKVANHKAWLEKKVLASNI